MRKLTQEEFDNYYSSNEVIYLDLDLSGLNLSGKCFKNVILADVNLDQADLSGAIFIRCTVNRATMTETNLTDTIWNRSLLYDSTFTQTNFDKSDWTDTHFSQRCMFRYIVFAGVSMHHCTFDNALVEDCLIAKSRMYNVKWYFSDIFDSEFFDMDLSSVDFSTAALHGTKFAGMRYMDCIGDGHYIRSAQLGSKFTYTWDIVHIDGQSVTPISECTDKKVLQVIKLFPANKPVANNPVATRNVSEE